MSDDLVKRLCDPDKWQEACLGQKGYVYADNAAPFEAADEITRLRESNAELEKEYNDAIEEGAMKICESETRIASLEAELDIANKQIAETGRAWTADRDSLRAKLERAKEALEPFKRFLDANEQIWADDATIAVSTGEGRTHEDWMTFGHIRRARAVLAELSADAPAPTAHAIRQVQRKPFVIDETEK